MSLFFFACFYHLLWYFGLRSTRKQGVRRFTLAQLCDQLYFLLSVIHLYCPVRCPHELLGSRTRSSKISSGLALELDAIDDRVLLDFMFLLRELGKLSIRRKMLVKLVDVAVDACDLRQLEKAVLVEAPAGIEDQLDEIEEPDFFITYANILISSSIGDFSAGCSNSWYLLYFEALVVFDSIEWTSAI